MFEKLDNKILSFYCSKDTVEGIKRATDLKKIFVNYKSDEGHFSRICKELLKFINK